MKNYNFEKFKNLLIPFGTITLFLSLLCAVTACQNDLIDASEPELVRSRSTTADEENESLTNPTLIYDWEDVTEIELNQTGKHSVTAPWCDGASTVLTSDFTYDIRKSDGWDMLFHTFKKKGLNENTSYMFFYNKFTGFLKIFYYNESLISGGTDTQWVLSQDDGTLLKMFDKPSFFQKQIMNR